MQRASVLLICLIVLGNLLGCSAVPVLPVPAPVVVTVQQCARPTAPTLLKLRGDISFDSPGQVEATLTRDARLRLYAAQLNDALDCYDTQAKGAASD